MIRWIQQQSWQSSLMLSGFSFLVFGGIDIINVGISSIFVSLILAGAVYLARQYRWYALGAICLGALISIVLQIRPGAAAVISLIAVALVAAFGDRLQQLVALPVSIVSGLLTTWFAIYQMRGVPRAFGITVNQLGSLNLFLFSVLIVTLASVLAWLTGRLWITQATHVGTAFDRAIAERTQAKLSLDIAEQNERFEIARDISELVIQRISATISLAEGGAYATTSDPASAPRILDQVAASARSGHKELRRLYDLFNKTHQVTPAPPRIDDIEQLVIAYRELGYNITMKHDGNRFEIDEGAELAIYRIVFEALENIRKHTPLGTDLTIDFAWTDGGLQVLIKDNGTEVRNRGLDLEQLGYSIEEDRKALVETITGVGLGAMAERAALYNGTIEATRVPGVGFTVSAIFPDLRLSAKA